MKKEDLENIYKKEKINENNLNNMVNNYLRELNKLKLSSLSHRVRTNFIISLIILFVFSKSALFYQVVESVALSEMVLTILFGMFYGVSDVMYRFIVGNKYGIDMFKKTSEKDRIQKELEYSIKLEKIKNEDSVAKDSLNFLNKKIKVCHSGLPLFSKNYYLDKGELEDKVDKLNNNVVKRKENLNQNIEELTLKKVSRNYSLIYMIFKFLLNVCISSAIIVILPLLLNIAVSGVFQGILSFLLFSGYLTSKIVTFNDAREVFDGYNISLLSLKNLNINENEKKIIEERDALSKCVIDQIEAKTVLQTKCFIESNQSSSVNVGNTTLIPTINSQIKDKPKVLLKK